MNDTPRTDAEAKKSEGDYYYEDTVPVEFARQLERENIKLKDALRSVMLAGTATSERIALHNARKLLAELDAGNQIALATV